MKNSEKMKDYESLPFQEWDGKTPLVIFNDDKYFFDQDDIESYLEDINSDTENLNNHKKSTDLQLVICRPNKLWQLDFSDVYLDILPEDQYFEDIASKELIDAANAFNEAIANNKEASWGQGMYRTTVDIR